MDIKKLVEEGRAKLIAEHKAEEALKIGTYRVGSGGIYVDGEVIGSCHRKAIARSMGIDTAVDPRKQLMFAAGHGNEDIMIKELSKSSFIGKIKREDECSIEWETSGGTKVSGRPDIVFFKEEVASYDVTNKPVIVETPVIGMELKLVSSLWTARDVYFDRNPKSDHLIQAGHYASKLGVPFVLWYTNRAEFAVPDWAAKFFNKKDPAVSLNKKGDVGKILEFDMSYMLDFDGDRLYYKNLEGGLLASNWVETKITKQSIVDYFEYLDYLKQHKDLGPRPSKSKVTGGEQSWSRCDPAYCEYSELCDKFDNEFDQWIDSVKAKQP